MKTLYAAFAVLAMGALFGGPAQATPTGPISRGLVTETQATPVADYRCRRDDRGWYSMHGDRRVDCRPERPHEGRVSDWNWRCEDMHCGWWHRHEHRWHDEDRS